MDAAVHVIDDDSEIRKALQWLFESVDLHVRTYHSADDFLVSFNSSLRGCIIMDVRMPGMSGLELLDQLNSLNNTLPVIMMTGHGDVPMVVRVMKAGAVDFILKPINEQMLLETIYKNLHRSTDKAIASSPSMALLTQREQEVISLIIEGKYNKEIAADLNISISTVEAHRSHIMDKFQAKNMAQLIKAYYQIS